MDTLNRILGSEFAFYESQTPRYAEGRERNGGYEEPLGHGKVRGKQGMMLVFQAAQISAEYGVDPVHEPPVKACICVVEVPIVKRWGTVTDEVAREPACIDKALY